MTNSEQDNVLPKGKLSRLQSESDIESITKQIAQLEAELAEDGIDPTQLTEVDLLRAQVAQLEAEIESEKTNDDLPLQADNDDPAGRLIKAAAIAGLSALSITAPWFAAALGFDNASTFSTNAALIFSISGIYIVICAYHDWTAELLASYTRHFAHRELWIATALLLPIPSEGRTAAQHIFFAMVHAFFNL